MPGGSMSPLRVLVKWSLCALAALSLSAEAKEDAREQGAPEAAAAAPPPSARGKKGTAGFNCDARGKKGSTAGTPSGGRGQKTGIVVCTSRGKKGSAGFLCDGRATKGRAGI